MCYFKEKKTGSCMSASVFVYLCVCQWPGICLSGYDQFYVCPYMA